MTEEEWLTCAEPERMLQTLRDRATERKLRFVAGQFCLNYFAVFSCPEGFENTKEMAEETSDYGRLSNWRVEPESDRLPSILLHKDAFVSAVGVLKALVRWIASERYEQYLRRGAFDAPPGSDTLLRAVDACYEDMESCQSTLWIGQSHLLREIFGNPFRPVTFDIAWRTTDAMLLAHGIYEEHAFDRMPILADALQEAGCDCADLLNHLRDPSATHVRGCWALDLVLGK